MKIYRALSNLSISIALPNGKPKYIMFDPESNGTSTYTATSKAVIEGLEKHRLFGKVFKVEAVSEDEVKEKDKVSNMELPVINQEPKEEKELEMVKVNSWDDAKNYLVETLGYTAGKVNTQSKIQKAADKEGIKFLFS